MNLFKNGIPRFTIALSLCLFLSPLSIAHAADDVTITVNPDKKVRVIPTDFLGLSIEKSTLCPFIKATKQNGTLINLFSNLSPAVLRIGGSSMNNVTWTPNAQTCNGTSVTPTLVGDTFNFLNKIKWKVIWGVNLNKNTAALASDESKSVADKGGSTLKAIEIGNEPEATFAYTAFKTKWTEFADAVKKRVPSIALTGSASYSSTFLKQFITDKHGNVSFATFHTYPGGADDPSDPNNVKNKLAKLLSASLMKESATGFSAIVAKAAEQKLTVRLGETNNISHGGTTGASDTYASALWVVDYLFTALEHGIKGVNMHGHPDGAKVGPYTPIASTAVGANGIAYARPEYYGLLLFHQAAPNGYTIPIQTNTTLNVAAHALINTDNTVRIVIINKEQQKTATVKINTTKAYASATSMQLKSPSLTATITSPTGSSITLGGKPVASDGTWSPQTTAVKVDGASSTITLLPISAVLLTYTASYTPSPKTTPTVTPTPTTIPPTPNGNADLNHDGKVNAADADILLKNFGVKGTPGFTPADIDKNGVVNIFDYNMIVKKWTANTTLTPTKKPTVTPTKKATPTPTKKVTPTPTKKATPTPTKKPTATPTKRPTVTPTKTPTPTPKT